MDVYDLIHALENAGLTYTVCVMINGERHDISFLRTVDGYVEIYIV